MVKDAKGNEVGGLEQGPFEPIAVIGVSALMPDAPDIETFWQNILDAKVSIRKIPEHRWIGPAEHFYREGGPGDIEEGFTYARIGAVVEGYDFDWRRWRLPPGTLPQIDLAQQWAVSVAASAIEHAGYDGESKDIDRLRTGVAFANALGGENRNLSNIRIYSNHTKELAKSQGMPEENSAAFMESIVEGAPRINEDTMPGELANVVAGRVSNLLDLQGPNFAMDAACASSLATLMEACRLLQMRQVDVMIAGATDRSMDAPTFAKFSAIGALSASHSTPFDAGANGFVMGEGAGAFVLKRLSDAIRDGDEVHAVIRGVGGSSDGRGKGITAPSQRGQIQAIARAYAQAEYAATTVELIEAHGTSTKVGDATELGTLSLLWDGMPAGDNVAVGSIKSQVGHLKAAAGIAGLIKAVMALHHRTIPPSAGFNTPNPTVDWNSNPFFVPTQAREWPRPTTHPRRAGVSAFGFGGTNYHVALEGFEPEYHSKLAQQWDVRWDAYSKTDSSSIIKTNAASIHDASATASMTHDEMKAIEGGILLLSAGDLSSLQTKLEAVGFTGAHFDEDPRGLRLSSALNATSSDYDASEAFRMCIVATSWNEYHKRIELASKAMNDPEKWGFLQAQGILLTNDPALHPKAKVAHMYPGQGSQYVGMTHDLHQRYSAVQKVWAQADETMVDVLEGESLSSFVLRSNLSKEQRVEAEHKLKQTEYTQPAMLTADLAIERALNDHGQMPDMVAGHSLGEYAALMSAGILDMDGALRASAARGTEMGSVVIDDKGLMASVMAPYDDVASILESIDGYVIAANKNSPKMTVIAGETEPVQQAMVLFEEKGFQCVPLATSHAFHSRIVAPANEPLRRFLESLEIRWPSIPITANVDGSFYPMEGEDSKAGILGKLAPQMASAVEWTTQIETMYAAGARAFIEVGPKRALTMFAVQILEDQPHLPIMSNHPKQGGIASFLSALGTLALAGRQPQWPADDSSVLTEAFRAGPMEAYYATSTPVHSTAEMDDLRTRSRPLPSTASPVPIVQQVVVQSATTQPLDPEVAAAKAKTAYIGDRLAAISGYPAGFCHGMVNLRLGLGMSDAEVSTVIQTLSNETQTDAAIDISTVVTAADLTKLVVAAPSSWIAKTSALQATKTQVEPAQVSASAGYADRRLTDPYVITGISLGLPGGERVFDEDTFERLVRGETCLSEVSDEYKQRLLDKNIVRLIKGRDGSVNMDQATEFGDIPQLAGIKSAFDISEEFGIDPKVVLAWDITTQLAVAAGLLALRDAAIPLTPVEQIGKGGLRLIRNWQVPQIHRERTGIVFASCFPGLQMAMKHAKSNGDDGEGRFDRRYLFQTLNMGHSQFAQYSGIRGPNTTINLACASTTAAFGVAEDWLNSDRVDRVVILSADDVTGEDLWEWIGGGFAASGAAATGNVIEEAALPFDRRRNGLVLGMGAAAFVIERHSEAKARGVQPIAELLGTRTANSAFHGTRLDVDHVAETVNSFISSMEQQWGINRHEMAPDTVFFSHETYTPARGGSAQSEVRALRETFGESTDSLVIANTKGFTGHPMGVGIEDASMFHGMKTGRIPPIANHKETDPELGNLNLSKGGDYSNIQYGLRFAAGFGSQMALSLVRKWPITGERIDGQRFLEWNRALANTEDVVMRILDNKLVSYVNGDDNLHGGVQGEPWPITAAWEGKPSEVLPPPQPTPVQATPIVVEPVAQPEPAASPSPSPSPSTDLDLVSTVIEVVVNHTGYPADFVELDQDLEGELGIDTVKQAEIMADIRERFALPLDEEFVLSDYPTLTHMIGYIQKMTTGGTPLPIATPPVVSAVVEASTAPTPTSTPVGIPLIEGDEQLVDSVVEVVVQHTGYPADFVELDQDLEGELGIDTVKQAEIMADIRERFTLPLDEEFVLSDYPTLNHMIGYIQKMTGGSVTVKPTAAPASMVSPPLAQPMPVTSSPAAVVVEDSDLTSIVVDVVVQHTGYPSDFIELDQDLEGELGIDTVKQAEIMADIRERFTLPLDEEFVLSDYPTLNHMIGYIQRMKGDSSVPVVPVVPVAPAPPTPVTPQPSAPSVVAPAPLTTDSNIQEQLIEVVVRHTGYPNDFIELDQDLEGELGIDTVKQAEIMADVRDIFELPLDEEFVLSDHPTLNHFTAYIHRMKGGSAVEHPAAPPVTETVPVALAPITEPVVAEIERQENCRRWQVEVEGCPGTSSLLALEGTIVVTDDGWGIAEAFCQRVEARGMRAVRIGFESEIRDMSSHQEAGRTVYRADPANPEHLALVCKELEQFDVAGLVHMAPMKLAGASWGDDTQPSSQIALSAHGYFSLLQGLDAHLASRKDGLVASVTAMDGRHGNIGERFNSVQCAASGVTKSYSFEQTHLRMRALDLHPELILDADQAAEHIDSDLFEIGGEIEIGLDRDGRRWTLVAFAENLENEMTPLQSDDTWIVSGGGSGVTAASVIGVACNSLNAGAHFALLGRSTLLEETETWVEWSDSRLNEQKNALREELMAASESGKVTMVEWNTAWQKYSRSRDVYITIKTIQETGNDASYHSVDVMDTDGLKQLGASLGRPITGIIHGAGLEDSKLVASKEYSVFDKVIRVKIDGWQSLLAAVEASKGELRFASCFTSVSGRFGNNGQTDYSAANSVLDAEMARLTASGSCRAVAIAWTGWRDVGMATRGSFQAVFDAAGIDTISVEKGVEIFVGEALQGGKRRVLGCGNLGTMDAFDAFREAPLRLPAEMASIIADPFRFPFIDKVLSVDERQSLTTQTTLSVADHPFLSDHAIDGVPYHPGVMALEMFAENALLLRPSACLAGFEDVSFGLPVKLLKGEMAVRVHAELIRGDGEMSWVACRLLSDLSNSKGEVFGEREHHKAIVRVVESREDLGPFLQSEVDALPQLGTPALGELAELPSFIYRRYFHGPRFQSHGGVLRGIGDAEMPGADGIALMRHQLPMLDQFALETQGEVVLLESLPMLIEAGFQNAGLVAMESEGFSSLPVGIEWSSMLRVPERNEVLRMRSLRTAVEDAGITVHDVVVVGDDDAPVIALKGLRLKSMAPVPVEESFTLER